MEASIKKERQNTTQWELGYQHALVAQDLFLMWVGEGQID